MNSVAAKREKWTAWLFCLPGMGIIGLFIVLTTLLAFLMSFTFASRFGDISWAGLANYQRLFSDADALASLWHTLLFVIGFVPLNLMISLGIALLLNQAKQLLLQQSSQGLTITSRF